MNTKGRWPVGLWVIALLTLTSVASAANGDLRLVTAAAGQDAATVRALLKEGVDVNAARPDGTTALLWAAHWDDLDSVDRLLRAGANVNSADYYGVTPLDQAAENASAAVVEKLLAAGADPNAAQVSGLTPLMIAANTGNIAVVKALVARGANINAQTTKTKDSALMWAIAQQHADIVRVLLENGANVKTSTTKGFTPLRYAAVNGDIEMAKFLLAAGANVNDIGEDGTHILPFSIVAGQLDFAMFLIEQGADPNAAMSGFRALHAAAGSVEPWLEGRYGPRSGPRRGPRSGGSGGRNLTSKLKIVKALLEHGADPNARITTSAVVPAYVGYPTKGAFEPFACGTGDHRGATPLWVAAYATNGMAANIGFGYFNAPASNAEIIRVLLAAGADHRLTTDDGTTPLMAAAGLGRATYTPGQPRGELFPPAAEAVKALVEVGADINAVNEAGFTALHGAAYRGLNEIVQFLVDHGAGINARDFRGRTPYRLAEGSKQGPQFQTWPSTAELLKQLGANTRLGIPGTVQERSRDLAAEASQQ